jgi:hypothetical protein
LFHFFVFLPPGAQPYSLLVDAVLLRQNAGRLRPIRKESRLPAPSDASQLMEPFAAQWPLCARALRAQELHWTPKLNADLARAMQRALGEAAQIGQWVAHPANRQLPACWPVSQSLLELAGEFLSNLDFADRTFSIAAAQSAVEAFTARLLPLAALARKCSSIAPLGPSLPSHLGIELLAQTARIAELTELAGLGQPSALASELDLDASRDADPEPFSAADLRRRADGWRARAERVLDESRSFARRSRTAEWLLALIGFALALLAFGVGPASEPARVAHGMLLPHWDVLGARLGGGAPLLALSALLFAFSLKSVGACVDRALWALRNPTARRHRSLTRASWSLLSQDANSCALLLAATICFAVVCWSLGGFAPVL